MVSNFLVLAMGDNENLSSKFPDCIFIICQNKLMLVMSFFQHIDGDEFISYPYKLHQYVFDLETYEKE